MIDAMKMQRVAFMIQFLDAVNQMKTVLTTESFVMGLNIVIKMEPVIVFQGPHQSAMMV